MRVFITGASGYIGGSVAAKLVQNGYQVTGLTRSQASAEKLKTLGIEPVIGDLSDHDLIKKQAKSADIIINAANSDHRAVVETILDALYDSNKIYIHTSGSSVVADQANGEVSDRIFDEDTDYEPEPEKKARVEIDRLVLNAATKGVRSYVICPCLIYGEGLGIHKDSIQIPMLIAQAQKSGIARHIGKGNNVWSTVHVSDLADLYLLVVQKAPTAGTFFFAENGETTFKQIALSIAESLSLPTGAEAWPVEAALAEWGKEAAVFALGSNSRIRAKRARALGWLPKNNNPLDYVRSACGRLKVACH